MNAPLTREVVLRAVDDRQTLLPLSSEGVLRWLWDGKYGAILIEVVGTDVFVNGQRVEPHAT